jgi:hypothetical protein
MLDRRFNETDLRQMIEDAHDVRADHEPGRWVILTVWEGSGWEVIVEPQLTEHALLVVTAYRAA